jgi:hypothetical protein
MVRINGKRGIKEEEDRVMKMMKKKTMIMMDLAKNNRNSRRLEFPETTGNLSNDA